MRLRRSFKPLLSRRAVAVCSALVLAGAAHADDVHLRNGNVFEEVVAIDEGTSVVVRFGGGEMRLPKSRILRIDKALTSAQELAQRQQTLESNGGAADWLELADWAASKGLHSDSVAATLRAAEIDPEAQGLAPRMERLHHVRVDGEGWLHESVVMRRRGLVSYRGDWVTPEQKTRGLELERLEAETRRVAREERERELEVERKLARLERLEAAREEKAEAEAGPTDNDVALAQIDLLKGVLETAERRPTELLPQGGFLVPSFAGAVFRGRVRGSRDDTWRAMSVRQPGSLIPISDFTRTQPER